MKPVKRQIVIALALSIASSGCGVPRLDLMSPVDAASKEEVRHDEVIQIIQRTLCEIAESPHIDYLRKHRYIAVIQLSLKAEVADGLTPSLSFVHPFVTPMTSITKVVGGELSQNNLRSFSQGYAIDISKIGDLSEKNAARCGEGKGSLSLTGRLGMAEIIAAGLHDIDLVHPSVRWVTDKGDLLPGPAFGSTVQFILKKTVNGGPALVQVHFKGPNGTNGLVNVSRTTTDQLIIGFSPPKNSTLKAITARGDSEKVGPSIVSKKPNAKSVGKASNSMSFSEEFRLENKSLELTKPEKVEIPQPTPSTSAGTETSPTQRLNTDDDDVIESATLGAKSVVDTQIVQNLNLSPR